MALVERVRWQISLEMSEKCVNLSRALRTVLRAVWKRSQQTDVSASVFDLITHKLVQPTTARHFGFAIAVVS